MCACSDLGYTLSDISDNGRIVSTIQRERHLSQEYQPFLPPVSEQELYECMSQRVSVPICLQGMSGLVECIVNPTYHLSVEYSQLGYMLKSQYILCLFQYDFFHVYNVRVGWLLTSQMLIL